MAFRLWRINAKANPGWQRDQNGEDKKSIHYSYARYASSLIVFVDIQARYLSFLGDHIFGLLPLMASCLNGAGGTIDGIEDPRVVANDVVDAEVGDFAWITVSD